MPVTLALTVSVGLPYGTPMPPALLRTPDEIRDACEQLRRAGKRVGLVPTMGALHEGHLALVTLARSRLRCDAVVVSIFVNPTQFGPNEDLARYPRDLDGDTAKLGEATHIFAPGPTDMYPPGEETRVRVGALAEPLCGRFRPGHFEGVATIVAKLFALVGPCTAVFGEKDYQQLAVIRRMTADLFLPVEVVGHPIVRERDGLAMSSRNAYLSPLERGRALGLSRGLAAAGALFASGVREAARLRAAILAEVEPVATSIDYVELAHPDTLVPWADGSHVGERALAAIACRVGTTRLIDNVVLGRAVE
jgi:pantoate--beta-alanine ligase